MSEERRPRASVETARYQGVSVDHPSIVSSIKNLARQGRKVSEIQRIVGMPGEVVRKHAPHARTD